MADHLLDKLFFKENVFKQWERNVSDYDCKINEAFVLTRGQKALVDAPRRADALGVLLIISSLFVVSLANKKKDVTSILVGIVLGICV